MTRMIVAKRNRIFSKPMIVAGLGVSLTFGAFSLSAQQNQSRDDQATVERQPTHNLGAAESTGFSISRATESGCAAGVSDTARRDRDTCAHRRVAFHRQKHYR